MKENILLIYGGNSVEHEISIISSLQIKNYYYGKFNLILCYLKNGCFFVGDTLLDFKFYKSFNCKKLNEVFFKANQNYIKIKNKRLRFSAVFLLTHGLNCEDGTIAGYFKTLNIPCICQSLYYSSVGQNKFLSKKISNAQSLPYFYLDEKILNTNLSSIKNMATEIGYPLIIKPNNLGSSIGVSTINDFDQLIVKAKELLCLDNQLIIEKCLSNFQELNIAILEYKDNYIVSEIEKISDSKILTYNDKYLNEDISLNGLKKQIPALIDKKLKDRIISTAISIYKKMNASLIVRIDFLYDDKNDLLYFNEVNNIPGSLAYYLFNKNHISTNELIDMCLSQGLMTLDKENKLIKSYNKNIFNQSTFTNVKFLK